MALVAYDNSDSSEYEEDSETPVVVTLNKKLQDIPPQVQDNDLKESSDDQNLFNLLPKPTNQKTVIQEEDDEILHKRETITDIKPKSRITVPSLNDFKDVKDTVPSIKPKPTNGKKCGLLSILPQPKNGTKLTSKMLIPQSVSNKPQNAIAKKKESRPIPLKKAEEDSKGSLITDYSDESDDEVQNDFFSINKPVKLPPDNMPLDIDIKNVSKEPCKKEPRSLESYFKKDHVTLEPDYERMEQDHAYSQDDDSNNGTEMTQSIVEESGNNDVLDEEAIMKLCGTRGKRKREEIQIVDIDQQEVLRDAREMLLKGLMDDTTKRQSHSKKKGNEPTSQQKRKHQITYLAHQAKANEAELQNQWANNRMTKRQTQSKYGF